MTSVQETSNLQANERLLVITISDASDQSAGHDAWQRRDEPGSTRKSMRLYFRRAYHVTLNRDLTMMALIAFNSVWSGKVLMKKDSATLEPLLITSTKVRSCASLYSWILKVGKSGTGV